MSKLLSRADAARYCEENGIPHAKRKLEDYAAKGRVPRIPKLVARQSTNRTNWKSSSASSKTSKAKRGW